MTTAHSRRARRAVGLTWAFGALVCAVLGAAGPERAAGAAPDARPEEQAAPPGDIKWVGAAVCQGCHNTDKPAENRLYKQTLGFEFVRLKENQVWEVHDLHSTAYKNLLTDRTVKGKKDKPNATAQRMEDNLRRYKGPDYTVATDTGCLACHASVKQPISPQAPPAKWVAASFATIDGVGCEMCHGHGSAYQQKHQESDDNGDPKPGDPERFVGWREWSPADKQKWGLVNLRDPVAATERCASCHVGNTQDGRFVIHEWYAAGHPPLPPLDLQAYTREQPRHWGLPSELPYFAKLVKKDAKKAEAVFGYRTDESYVARRFVESAVAGLGSAATLTGQLAEAGKDDGLDYAAFDCSSCHHNLKYPSDRQVRGYAGRPGRPLFRPAALALARVVVEHAAGMKGGAGLKDSLAALTAAEKDLALAFTNKTYGDAPKIVAAAAELKKWTDDTHKKLAAVRYTPDETEKLLAKVIEAAEKPVGDPEVAQLYAWAYETLVLDLVPPTEGKDKNDKTVLIPPGAVKELRDKLQGTVVTRLRPGAMFHYEVEGGTPGPTVESVNDRLSDRMKTFNAFQDATFRKAFLDAKPFGK